MIVLKHDYQIDKIRQSCRLTAKFLQFVIDLTKTEFGLTTKKIDELATSFAMDNGAIPAFRGYKGFPHSACTSVNDEVIHGLPNNKPLQEGDILSVDYGILLDGYYSDSAITVPIGEVPKETYKLIKTGQECLYRGINEFCEDSRLNKISYSIQKHAESNGFEVVRDFVGHGLGKNLHEAPQVFNFTNEPDEGVVLQKGLVLAIEPMITVGNYKLVTDKNGWTVRTVDGSLSTHWEHTVALTENGPEILTLRTGEDI
jgi:methionyl aminopeptidase